MERPTGVKPEVSIWAEATRTHIALMVAASEMAAGRMLQPGPPGAAAAEVAALPWSPSRGGGSSPSARPRSMSSCGIEPCSMDSGTPRSNASPTVTEPTRESCAASASGLSAPMLITVSVAASAIVNRQRGLAPTLEPNSLREKELHPPSQCEVTNCTPSAPTESPTRE